MPAQEVPLDPDALLVDDLLLVSLPGALDYLVADLSRLRGAMLTRRWADAVLVHYEGTVSGIASIRYFSSCAVWLDADPAIGDPEPGLALSRARGLVGLVEGEAPVTFRVADIGPARWPLRDRLVVAGWENSPGDWRVNLTASHGSLVAEIGAMHQTARFGELARLPASTTPVIAAVLTRLAKARAGDVVLDPFCGAGTNLVLAGASVPEAQLLGLDVSPTALTAARANLAARGLTGSVALGDATRLPLAAGSIDRVVANLPFGKRVGTHANNVDLYPAFARQLTRVLRSDGRAVLLTEEKRLLRDAVQRTAGLRVIKEVEFETGGLHPSAYVVVRGRARSRGRA